MPVLNIQATSETSANKGGAQKKNVDKSPWEKKTQPQLRTKSESRLGVSSD